MKAGIALNIRKIRDFFGITQVELDHMCKVSAGSTAQWESGKREPSVDNLRKLKKGIGCTYEKLIDG